jgi:hypothetical protein
MPYYWITILTKQRKESFRGIRLMETWNSDAAWRMIESKAKSHFGSSVITKHKVVMLSKKSQDVKDIMNRGN